MKVIAIFGDASNQRALANRIHQSVPLAYVAKIRLESTSKRKIIRSVVSLTIARGLRNAWAVVSESFDTRFKDWPAVPNSVHPSSNDEDLAALIEREKPDLVLVSGTDILRKNTLDRFATRIMNLHTGISPYIKGGPNCTNWALSLREFDLIGNTIMWIDSGIDTGAIIVTEQTPLTGRESLTELHIKVMDHAHDLYRRAVERFATGQALPAVPQDQIAKGRIFFSRQWNSFAMVKAVFNHRFRWRPMPIRPNIKLVNL